MKIENLRFEQTNQRNRVAATISWEDQQRPVFDMYFETDGAYAHDLTCNPHAFLIASIMPAFCHEEQRIRIEAPIDPELLEGMQTAMRWIRHWWYNPSKKLVKIEAPIKKRFEKPGKEKRTGMFFSGGIDSLAALRANRLTFSNDHPRYIHDGLIVFGLETDQEESFRHVLASISHPAMDAGLNLIPVYTNARHLDADWMFWERKSHDAVLASIAYSLSDRFSEVVISSTYDIPSIQPAGSHPLLDLAYSSHQLTIRHDSISLPRLEKVKLVTDWEVAFQSMRVCNKSQLYKSGKLNCGKCIKCVRTILELEALGRLETCQAFSSHQITPEMLMPAVQVYRTTVAFYEPLVQPLRDRKRNDLVYVIQKKIDDYQKNKGNKDLVEAIKNIVKRYDRKYFNSRLIKFKRNQPAVAFK
jgi:hypothetical protein